MCNAQDVPQGKGHHGGGGVSLQGAADGSPGDAALLDETHLATSFWAGANIGEDDFIWCIQTERGLFLHVALGLYPCAQQQQQRLVVCRLSGLKAVF